MDKETGNSCYSRETVNKTERFYKVKCNIMKVALDNLPGLQIALGGG